MEKNICGREHTYCILIQEYTRKRVGRVYREIEMKKAYMDIGRARMERAHIEEYISRNKYGRVHMEENIFCICSPPYGSSICVLPVYALFLFT